MKNILLTNLFFLNYLALQPILAFAEEFNCAFESQNYFAKGAAEMPASARLVKFKDLKDELLKTINAENFNESKFVCLDGLYNKQLFEVGQYWADYAKEKNCSDLKSCESKFPEIKKSSTYLKNLDREYKAALTARASDASSKNSKTKPTCEVKPADKVAGLQDIRDHKCCGEKNSVSDGIVNKRELLGQVGTLYPEDNYGQCLDRIKSSNKTSLSGEFIINCIGKVFTEAVNTVINNVKSLIKSVVELKSTLSELWNIATDSDYRNQAIYNLVESVKSMAAGATECLNSYEQGKYICKLTGQIIGQIGTGKGGLMLFKFLSGKAGSASKLISEQLAKTNSGKAILEQLGNAKKGGQKVVDAYKNKRDQANDKLKGAIAAPFKPLTKSAKALVQKAANSKNTMVEAFNNRMDKFTSDRALKLAKEEFTAKQKIDVTNRQNLKPSSVDIEVKDAKLGQDLKLKLDDGKDLNNFNPNSVSSRNANPTSNTDPTPSRTSFDSNTSPNPQTSLSPETKSSGLRDKINDKIADVRDRFSESADSRIDAATKKRDLDNLAQSRREAPARQAELRDLANKAFGRSPPKPKTNPTPPNPTPDTNSNSPIQNFRDTDGGMVRGSDEVPMTPSPAVRTSSQTPSTTSNNSLSGLKAKINGKVSDLKERVSDSIANKIDDDTKKRDLDNLAQSRREAPARQAELNALANRAFGRNAPAKPVSPTSNPKAPNVTNAPDTSSPSNLQGAGRIEPTINPRTTPNISDSIGSGGRFEPGARPLPETPKPNLQSPSVSTKPTDISGRSEPSIGGTSLSNKVDTSPDTNSPVPNVRDTDGGMVRGSDEVPKTLSTATRSSASKVTKYENGRQLVVRDANGVQSNAFILDSKLPPGGKAQFRIMTEDANGNGKSSGWMTQDELDDLIASPKGRTPSTQDAPPKIDTNTTPNPSPNSSSLDKLNSVNDRSQKIINAIKGRDAATNGKSNPGSVQSNQTQALRALGAKNTREVSKKADAARKEIDDLVREGKLTKQRGDELKSEISIAESYAKTSDGPVNRFDKDRAEEVKKFIELSKQRGKQNRDLDFANTLSIKERHQVSEELIGRKLTDKEKAGLEEAHKTGNYDFDKNSPTTIAKRDILEKAGFSRKESAILRGNGIAGSWDDSVRNAFRGQTASIPRSDGSRSKATIARVVERDSSGNPTVVEVTWSENGKTMVKAVDMWDLRIDYKVGQKIFFGRSSGGFTQGEILKSRIDPRTGKHNYTVFWNENGEEMLKTVEANGVSHIPPGGFAGNQKGAGNNQQGSANRNNGPNDNWQPPPRPEPKTAPSSFDQAASVKPKSNNRIDFAADRPEMVRIVQSKGKVESLRQIQEVLNLPGNPSRDEIKMEVRRKIQKFNSDQNPDYGTVTKETSDALNDMLNFIKNLERGAGASP